ncbi:MAG: hypothetical protein Ct9H300mP11_24390 [Chloroflexota bacterium]|nr:MAG: hypothetical protein Ct9H300mP11_24390 [Chloroflexota bacterium]
MVDGQNSAGSPGGFPSGFPLQLPLISPIEVIPQTARKHLAAFKNALALGADGIELDVRLTRDQKLVVFHDHFLGRTAPGSSP